MTEWAWLKTLDTQIAFPLLASTAAKSGNAIEWVNDGWKETKGYIPAEIIEEDDWSVTVKYLFSGEVKVYKKDKTHAVIDKGVC